MKIQFFVIAGFLFFTGCSDVRHTIQNWVERHRTSRQQKIHREDIEKWKHDLAISEEEAEKLYRWIYDFAREKKLQGEISWKIGKALMEQASYELASSYMKNAFGGELKDEKEVSLFEEALPYFQKALIHAPLNPDLLYDAGLCYGNASRALGWEERRFRTAIYLLERGWSLNQNDTRFAYVLGILYGKTTNTLRNVEKAIRLFDFTIRKDPYFLNPYFAKAQVLVEEGLFQEAFFVYNEITEVIKDMYAKKLLRGDYTDDPRYRQAMHNMKELQVCIEGREECRIRRKE